LLFGRTVTDPDFSDIGLESVLCGGRSIVSDELAVIELLSLQISQNSFFNRSSRTSGSRFRNRTRPDTDNAIELQ
jgi:hypothetical protein